MCNKSALFLFIFSLALSACHSGTDDGDQALNGTTPAAYTNSAVMRHKPVMATSPGILLSAWADVGSMDSADNVKDRQAESRAETAPIGQKITWSNPDSGHSGTILPVSDGYSNDGAYCREFQQSVTLDGSPRQGRGKACQQPDGSWKVAAGG